MGILNEATTCVKSWNIPGPFWEKTKALISSFLLLYLQYQCSSVQAPLLHLWFSRLPNSSPKLHCSSGERQFPASLIRSWLSFQQGSRTRWWMPPWRQRRPRLQVCPSQMSRPAGQRARPQYWKRIQRLGSQWEDLTYTPAFQGKHLPRPGTWGWSRWYGRHGRSWLVWPRGPRTACLWGATPTAVPSACTGAVPSPCTCK